MQVFEEQITNSSEIYHASGTVKWFDPVKGYGFVIADDELGDILLHVSVLKSSGYVSIVEGATVALKYMQGTRGLQAVEVLEIDEVSVPLPELPLGQANKPSDYAQASKPVGDLTAARVKWFDKEKGFGFVNLFADSEDVFVHMETLRRYSIAELSQGEAILVRTIEGPRGRMASEVRPWSYLCDSTNSE